MGGPGSGNWLRRSSRATCEGQRRIALGVLLERGVLAPGRSGTPSWSVGDRLNGSIAFTAARDSLRPSYAVTQSDGRRENIDERVTLWISHQHLGGAGAVLEAGFFGKAAYEFEAVQLLARPTDPTTAGTARSLRRAHAVWR